jgi:hypothetical protein
MHFSLTGHVYRGFIVIVRIESRIVIFTYIENERISCVGYHDGRRIARNQAIVNNTVVFEILRFRVSVNINFLLRTVGRSLCRPHQLSVRIVESRKFSIDI